MNVLREGWQNALEGFSMIESPIIAELLAKNEVDLFLRVIKGRYGELPEDLTAAILANADGDKLNRWLDALKAESLTQFRQQTGL